MTLIFTRFFFAVGGGVIFKRGVGNISKNGAWQERVGDKIDGGGVLNLKKNRKILTGL